MTTCDRCSRVLRVNDDRNPNARLLRRSLTTGVCVNCAATAFLKGMEPLATVLREKGRHLLLAPQSQSHFAAVLKAGNADASGDEIDWELVVAQWDLP